MNIKPLTLCAVCILLAGCNLSQNPKQSETASYTTTLENAAKSSLSSSTDGLLDSYYLSPEDPIHAYLQNKSIKRFMQMWFEEYMGEEIEAHWDYAALAPVQLLDHTFQPIALPGETLFTCTFTTDDGRCGYIIISYGESKEGPYIAKKSLYETTPYLYDLRANMDQITTALKETDIDVAAAIRAERIDAENSREDHIILFTGNSGDRYVCTLGDGDFTLEKQ